MYASHAFCIFSFLACIVLCRWPKHWKRCWNSWSWGKCRSSFVGVPLYESRLHRRHGVHGMVDSLRGYDYSIDCCQRLQRNMVGRRALCRLVASQAAITFDCARQSTSFATFGFTPSSAVYQTMNRWLGLSGFVKQTQK